MARYFIGQRVEAVYDAANDAATGSSRVYGAWLSGPKGEAVIVDIMAPPRVGLEERYVVRFDDGEKGLFWESELTPVNEGS